MLNKVKSAFGGKKLIISITVIALFLILSFPALAKNKTERPKGLEDKGPLTKITFIHYKKGHARPDWAGKPKKKDSACYKFLAKGAKWKTTEDYLINPDSLDPEFVNSAVNAGVDEWETYGGGDIFGEGSLDNSANYNNGDKDEVNTLSFGTYDEGVIAVATIWGYFSGPPGLRELVEWDILFNDYYVWGNGEANPALMDLQNITTHELGHSAGMDDLYETSCTEETMYGYSDYGETKKRDLNPGDIIGIQELYK